MTTWLEDMLGAANEIAPSVVNWRRHLHQHPELSFQEFNTAAFVHDTLQSFGSALALSRPTPTSVVARLQGSKPGKTLAIRADMDALPILEDSGLDFASANPGVMHACGHDGHTAMLLGTAKVLSQYQNRLQGEVRFIFQHAEELPPGGAEELVEAGVMDGVDMVIGIHLESQKEAGKLFVRTGAVNAAPDTFHVKIIGKGGHAAYPHTTVDSVAIAAQVIVNLQHVVSRNKDPLDPLVVSVSQIGGGTAYNIIPGVVEFGGTVRSYHPVLRDDVPFLMERVIQGVTAAHGAEYEFQYTRGYRPVLNDAELTRSVEEILVRTFGTETVRPYSPGMAGEDFSAYQTKAPGTFFVVGAGGDTHFPHHHPKFSIDESALPMGVKAFVTLTAHLLGNRDAVTQP